MEEENPGIEGTGAQTVEEGATQTPPSGPMSRPERLFTREEVNSIMQRRIGRSHNAFFTRYGVKDLSELDNLFGQSKSYGPLKERFDELEKSHNDQTTAYKDLIKKYAYRVNNVDEARVNDIETYFKGKDIEIDENTLAKEIKTHPEWVKKVGKVQSIGAESTPSPEIDERELASKYFGVNLSRKRS